MFSSPLNSGSGSGSVQTSSTQSDFFSGSFDGHVKIGQYKSGVKMAVKDLLSSLGVNRKNAGWASGRNGAIVSRADTLGGGRG